MPLRACPVTGGQTESAVRDVSRGDIPRSGELGSWLAPPAPVALRELLIKLPTNTPRSVVNTAPMVVTTTVMTTVSALCLHDGNPRARRLRSPVSQDQNLRS